MRNPLLAFSIWYYDRWMRRTLDKTRMPPEQEAAIEARAAERRAECMKHAEEQVAAKWADRPLLSEADVAERIHDTHHACCPIESAHPDEVAGDWLNAKWVWPIVQRAQRKGGWA